MSLDKNDPQLTAYVLDELDATQRATVEAALKKSPELQLAVDEIRQTCATVETTLSAEPAETLTDAQREQIQEQSKQPTAMPRPKQRTGRRIAVALVASLLVALGVGVWMAPGNNLQEKISLGGANDVKSWLTADYGDKDTEGKKSRGDKSADNRSQSFSYQNKRRSPSQDSYANDDAPRADESTELDFGAYPPTESSTSGRPRTGLPVELDPSVEKSDPRGAQGPHRTDFGDVISSVPASELSLPSANDGDKMPGDSARPARNNIDKKYLRKFPWASVPDKRTPKNSPPPSDIAGKDLILGDVRGQTNTVEGKVTISAVKTDPTDPNGLPDDGEGDNEGQGGGQGKGDSKVTPSPDIADPKKGTGKEGEEDDKKNPPAKKPKNPNTRTWRRARATPNASRLMVGDREELPIEGMQVNVQVDGFRARVLLDMYYYNNHSRQLEGALKLRLPEGASLYYFAFGQTSFEYRPMVDQLASKGFLTADLVRASGTNPGDILKSRSETWSNVKEARIVAREKAAHSYSETVRRRVDPALVEWSGAGVFNARVYPLLPNKLHRVVIGYDVNLRQEGDALVYDLDVPADLPECVIDMNVSALPGTSAEVKPAVRPFTSGGRAYYHFKDPKENKVSVRVENPGTVLLTGGDAKSGEFFATRFTPKLPAGEKQAGSSRAIFLVDTSLSSNPDKFNVWLKLLEATLTENRDTMKEFGVVFFNVESHWWGDSFHKNTPETVKQLLNHCNTHSLEGATDLRQALAEALSPSWRTQTDNVGKETIRPDLFLLSDGAVTWGELNLHLIAKTLKQDKGGTLFAYKTGMTGTAVGVLEHLARESGGAVFSVVGEEEVVRAATAHRNRPWQLLDATVTGGSDTLTAGRIRSIYPGQSLLLVGRGKPEGSVTLQLRRGNETKTIAVPLDQIVESDLTSRLYGQVAVGQLEDLGSSLEDISVAYARHFRVTGQTCSLLMLESEADYRRFNIKPEDDRFVVKSTPAAELIVTKIDELTQQLEDPKAFVKAWMAKLEKTPGIQFKTPTALRLAMEKMPQEAFEVTVPRLVCKERGREKLSKKFFQQLDGGRLDYDAVTEEAARRLKEQSAADALKALSSLIERNPGDVILARDVAFSAIEWDLSGQAYPLLKRVALARPYLPQTYQAMGRCLAELGNADMAIVYYEIALAGQWHGRYKDFHQIVGIEYLDLLRRVAADELQSSVPQFAEARLQSLSEKVGIDEADLVITMMWNTDRTDVDLHVLEPSGEEVFYKNRQSRGGGQITHDVTEGFGPEMYTLKDAKHGKYQVKANYYGTDNNRTTARTKVYVTVYEGFGTKRQRITNRTVMLRGGKEKRDLISVMVEK